jgi:hypothetical protein
MQSLFEVLMPLEDLTQIKLWILKDLYFPFKGVAEVFVLPF